MAFDPEEDWIDPQTSKKIGQYLKDYKTIIKIIGLFALLMAAVVYGQNQYVLGRSDQCIDMDGFLFYENDYLCMQEPWLSEHGFTLDKEKKQLRRQIQPLTTNLTNFNWSSIKVNLTELGLDENGSFINETA